MAVSQELVLELQVVARRFVAVVGNIMGLKSRIRVLLQDPDAGVGAVETLEARLLQEERLLAQIVEDLRVLYTQVPDPEQYLGITEARMTRAYLQRSSRF